MNNTIHQKKNYTLAISIPSLPKIITNGSQGSFWYKVAEKKKWHKLICLNVGMKKPSEPLTKCSIICTRYSSVRPDRDNLAASFKYVIDALVKCGVLVDDNDDVIVEIKYRWLKAAPKDGSIQIEVSEVRND